MPRGAPRAIRPSRPLNTHLDEELMVRLDLLLWSDVEARIPKGAYKAFFEERLREYFSSTGLDLSPFVGTLPGEAVVRAKPETVELLRRHLESQS